MQGHFSQIQKALSLSAESLQAALHLISRLNPRPASIFSQEPIQTQIPDLSLSQNDNQGWIVSCRNDELPPIRIRKDYVQLDTQPLLRGEKKQLRGWIASASWLQRCVKRRSQTLLEIGKVLLSSQLSFFLGKGPVQPVSIQVLAERLHVHPATAWRAVTDKVIACPQGTISLRRFFSGSASQHITKTLLQQVIQNEDKARPLSDQELMTKLLLQGKKCSRRMIAKYRQSLCIGTAKQRKFQSLK